MRSPPIAAPRRHRLARSGRTLALIVVGTIFDTTALVNVPWASVVDAARSEQLRISEPGMVLFMLVAAAWVTVVWRRSRPLVTATAGAVLAMIGVSYVLLLVGAVAVVRRHPKRMRPVAALTVMVVALFALREATTNWGGALSWYFTTRTAAQYEPAWILASFVWAVLSLALAAGILRHLQTRARAAQSDVRAEEEHRRADALTAQMVRQAERERIARDMHDALAHRLSVVSLHAGALEAAAATSAGGATALQSGAGDIARTVREQTHAALQDMRGLIGDLRGGESVPMTAPASMRAIGPLLSEFRAGGTPVQSHVLLESPERAAALLDSAVFRIVQESLTNAMKHAPGAGVDVFVHVAPQDGARIRVVNPLSAVGAPGIPSGGNGALGIRERAAALGGEAWIGAHDGSFIVDVTLPWQERG